MQGKVKTLQPNELLTSFMTPGSRRQQVFKQGYERFYIARLQDLTEISKPPIPPVKSLTHSLLFLQTGAIFMKVGSHSIKVQANECIVIPAGQVFSYSHSDEEKSETGTGFICGFKDDFLTGKIGSQELLKTFEFLNVWGNPLVQLSQESAIWLSQSLERIWTEYVQNGLQNQLILQAHLIAALCDLNQHYQPLSDHKNKTAVERSNRFKALLYQKIRTTHKVADYAAMLNISPNHLNKSVKLITEKSPSSWIKETLVNEAKVLLFQTDWSIQEIATDLGIDDPSYFARLFKKQEGLSPGNFRKRIDLS